MRQIEQILLKMCFEDLDKQFKINEDIAIQDDKAANEGAKNITETPTANGPNVDVVDDDDIPITTTNPNNVVSNDHFDADDNSSGQSVIPQTNKTMIRIVDRPHQCRYCFKRFTKLHSLRSHMTMHKNRDHRRNELSFHNYGTFTTGGWHHMGNHIRVRSRDKPIRCWVCMKNFREYSELRKHLNTVHKGFGSKNHK